MGIADGISKSQVSRLCEEIDKRVKAFLTRPIEGDWPYRLCGRHRGGRREVLEHVPKKLLDFFDQDMLQLFDFERVLIDQTIPFDRDTL
jgi:Transposase, Mutator family